MNRAYFLSLVMFLVIFAGLATARPAVVALAIPLLLSLLTSLWRGPEIADLRVERSLSAERVQSGDEVLVTVKVINQGPALEEILLEDAIPSGLEVKEGSSRHLFRLNHGESIDWEYTLQGRRGYYGLKKVHITACETLGLGGLEWDIRTDGQLFILPAVLRLRRVTIRPRRTRIYSGTIPANQGGSGVEFFDVREYQKGDSPRWINWRATARHPLEVYANQFEQERSADVGLILDGRRKTNEFGGRPIFEYSVLAAAALADAFLNAGNRVGLLFYGRQIHWTLPGYGKLQGERILHDLSQLETGDSENFNELYVPRHLFPSRSQLVLVSPLVPEDYDALAALRMKGYQMLVVSPNPVLFEAAGLPHSHEIDLARRIIQLQRGIMLRRLSGAGIHVVDWDTRQPFENVAKRELERRARLPRGDIR